jgi:hypothetical protein
MTGSTVTYRLVGYRVLAFAVFGPMACVAVLLVLSLPGTTDPRLAAFIAFWLGVLAWNFYWFFFRVAYEVGVTDASTLRWRTIAASSEAPLIRIKSINAPFRSLAAGFRRISIDGQRSPLLIGVSGVGEVIAMIATARPDIPIQTGWLDRTYERFAIKTVRWRRVGGG